MIVRNVAEEAKNRREEMIQRIKDCGQYIMIMQKQFLEKKSI